VSSGHDRIAEIGFRSNERIMNSLAQIFWAAAEDLKGLHQLMHRRHSILWNAM